MRRSLTWEPPGSRPPRRRVTHVMLDGAQIRPRIDPIVIIVAGVDRVMQVHHSVGGAPRPADGSDHFAGADRAAHHDVRASLPQMRAEMRPAIAVANRDPV